MHIQLEANENNTICSYTTSSISIGSSVYHNSVIISRNTIISPWPIHSIQQLDKETIGPLLQFEPEIIIIGQQPPYTMLPIGIMEYLSKQRIGIECMAIGAASRTFNVLLSEGRRVVAGIIFD